jgi:uncharacterized protein
MSITMSTASLPVFRTALANLDHCLGKAAAYAELRKFDVNVLVQSRLAPDMLTFASQIRIAGDAAKLCVARLSGLDAPKFDDTETTFTELRERVAKTLTWLDSVPADALDGTEGKEITFPVGRDRTRTMQGEDYLKHWALPNVFFHVTTAYALMRHNGVDLGKIDYLLGAAQPA